MIVIVARRVRSLFVAIRLIAKRMIPPLLGLALFMALSATATAARADGADTTASARVGPIVVHGNEADNLLLGAGVFDLRHDPSGAGTVEYRLGRKVFVVGLALGLMANTDGGLFGYVGAYGDLSYKRLYVTPQLAMGGYGEGGSKDLGGVFQFRQSLDVTYRFDNGHRLGIRAAHISNASIHDINPGEEELLLTYSVPVGPYL
ncbi:MAG TPA: acyloxyacyl hydrolase [Geminicoccaceae bacterium]